MNALANSLGKYTASMKGDAMPKRSKWLAVTGLDGSGKTNLVEDLANYYRSKGLRVQTAHLPYDTHLGTEVLPKLNASYADRLLFALDNYVFASQLEEWETEYDLIISQRCFFDSFVHGAVQGYSYGYIGQLNQIEKLPKVDVMVHLVASAQTAYNRIKDDPDADKFEYPAYIRTQELETRRGFDELLSGNPDLFAFSKTKNFLIDTTWLSMEDTFEQAKTFLESIKFMQ
ncbi:MAG: hypothetical protein IKF83_00825 [Clostridia bacterium]|nr:hypothetical protein [Clostridia bacterium]